MHKIVHKTLALFRMNVLILVLLIFTVAALLTHKYGLNSLYHINMASYPYIVPTFDSLDGGNSVVSLQKTDSSIIMDYELREGMPYPYAGLQIYLGDGKTQGKDLSVYDSVFLWIKPRGEGSVRLYLRGYDKDIYREGDLTSLKFNELEFFPLEESYPAAFVPQEFRVAGWWVAQNSVNVHKARVDISNVPLIEIQTGTGAPLGFGTFEIMGICFKGKMISELRLVSALIFAWFITFLIILVFRFMDYHRAQKVNKERQKELERNLAALEVVKNNYERESKTDPLTGCLNRAGFVDVLTREQERLNKHGIPVSFVIMDIDHFKDVNDTFGHNTGDEVLLNLSRLIQGKIRNTDALVRWGGEEFVVLCGDTPLQNAQFLAEKLRTAIESSVLIKQRQVTCSFGVAEMVPGEDPKNLFERADKALYASKEGGRNRVTSAAFRGGS